MDSKHHHHLNGVHNREFLIFQKIVAFGPDVNKLFLALLQVLMMLKGYMYI